MSRFKIEKVNVYEIQLDNILLAMENVTFGKDVSAKIIGSVKKLENLVAEGKIRASKPTKTQNGKWFCNAADVLRHCRNMRKCK